MSSFPGLSGWLSSFPDAFPSRLEEQRVSFGSFGSLRLDIRGGRVSPEKLWPKRGEEALSRASPCGVSWSKTNGSTVLHASFWFPFPLLDSSVLFFMDLPPV